jgi:hypothetical protein
MTSQQARVLRLIAGLLQCGWAGRQSTCSCVFGDCFAGWLIQRPAQCAAQGMVPFLHHAFGVLAAEFMQWVIELAVRQHLLS